MSDGSGPRFKQPPRITYPPGAREPGPVSPLALGEVVPPSHTKFGVRRAHNLETRVSQTPQNERGGSLGVDNFGRKVAAAEQIGEHLLRCQLSTGAH
jgi:hypothetical protein